MWFIWYRYLKILNKNPENGGYSWKDANNTLMAYVCDDCPSQPTGSIITVGPCALNWLNVCATEKIQDDGEIVEKIDHFHSSNPALLLQNSLSALFVSQA